MRSGFTASARVVTAAAVIMFAVFAAFVPEGDASLKPIALGLAVGIVIDAFVVRMTLVPAVMALLGEKAWWMPRWLDRVLPRFDIEGEAVERELALADWPEPDTTAVVVAEDLALADGDLELYRGASLRLEPRRVARRDLRRPARRARAAAHDRGPRRADRRPAARRRAPAARAGGVGARARGRRAPRRRRRPRRRAAPRRPRRAEASS